MKKKSSIPKKYRKRDGFYFFLAHSILLVGILFLENSLYPSARILTRLNILGRTSVVAVLLIGLLFLALEKDRLLNLKRQKVKWKQVLFFAFSHLLFFGLFYWFKDFVITNPEVLESHWRTMVFLRYFLPSATAFFLALTFLGVGFVKRFYKSLLLAAVLGLVFFQVSLLFKALWPYLAMVTTVSTAFILGLSFNGVVVDLSPARGPLLGAEGFQVFIEDKCSGMESLSLFLFLSLFMVVLEWKKIRLGRAVPLLIIGLVGMVLVNIFRIYSFFLVGIFYDPEFAIHTFHTNAGWIMFIVYTVVFWLVIFRWGNQREDVP